MPVTFSFSRQESFTRVNGVSLNTLVLTHPERSHDHRPVLVFLHDSLGCIPLWRSFPEQLMVATGCDAVLYDRQGYGKSDPFGPAPRTNAYLEEEADVLHQFLDALGLNDVILFGHSDGGSIALAAAAKYPQKIRGIITEGAHVFVEEITLQGIRAAVETYHRTNLREKLSKYHGDKTDAVFKAWTETWLSAPYRDWNIEHVLPNIICPSLIIQGDADEYGSPKQVDAITSQVAGASNGLMIPGIGHTPHKEAPEETLRASAGFIRTLL